MSSLNIEDIDERACINHRKRTEKMQETLKTYRKVGSRNTYLFKWLLKMYENLTLSCVESEYYDTLVVDKTKFAVLDTLIDDIADNMRHKRLLKEVTNIPFEPHRVNILDFSEKEIFYVKAVKIIWDDIFESIKKYPRFEEFREIFEFDVAQVMNSMRYGYMVNVAPKAINMLENRVYGHHAMLVIIAGMMDIMCSPSFDINELSQFRKVLYRSQVMARFGNMISTFEREIKEGDISNEVITMALEEGIISHEEIEMCNINDRITPLLENFNDDWEHNYKMIKYNMSKVKSVDSDRFLNERKFIRECYSKRVNYWTSEYDD